LKVYLIIASINELLNMAQFRNQLTETDHEIKVVIIEEGEETLRSKNKHLLRAHIRNKFMKALLMPILIFLSLIF